MRSLTLRDLSPDERSTLVKAMKFSENIAERRFQEVQNSVGEYEKARLDGSLLDTTVDLSSAEVESLVIALDEMLKEDIPEQYEDTPSSGMAGDMSHYYKQSAKKGCQELMARLK